MAEVYAKLQRQHRPSRWRHFRKRLRPVLATYLALMPVTVVVVYFLPRPRPRPFAADVVEGHFFLCGFVIIMIIAVTSALEVFHVGRRFRMRAEAFARALALWLVLAAFGAAGIALFNG